MTFLELCQKARRESRISGTGPAAVTGQQGVHGDIVSAVSDAWHEIQMMHESWRFLSNVVDAPLLRDKHIYLAGDLGINDFARPRLLLVENHEVKSVSWDDWIRHYRFNPVGGKGIPKYYAIGPENRIYLTPTPDKPMILTVDYIRTPQKLAANGDKPIIPTEQHHPVIAWKATMDLTANESDTVVYQKAYEKYDEYISRLEHDYLPPFTLGNGMF